MLSSKTTESLLQRAISLSSFLSRKAFQGYFVIKERTVTLKALIYRFEDLSFAGNEISIHHNFLGSWAS